MDWVPRSVRQKSKEVEEAIGRVEARLGRAASDEEVAKELGLSENAYNDTLDQDLWHFSAFAQRRLVHGGRERQSLHRGFSLESPAGFGSRK
jgi:RNA polymerase sigma factor for flagellar operon FliA